MVGGRREEIIDVTDDVEGMDDVDIGDYLNECALDFMNNTVDFGYEVLDD
jgi:hypothetical protein